MKQFKKPDLDLITVGVDVIATSGPNPEDGKGPVDTPEESIRGALTSNFNSGYKQ